MAISIFIRNYCIECRNLDLLNRIFEAVILLSILESNDTAFQFQVNVFSHSFNLWPWMNCTKPQTLNICVFVSDAHHSSIHDKNVSGKLDQNESYRPLCPPNFDQRKHSISNMVASKSELSYQREIGFFHVCKSFYFHAKCH